MIRLFISLCFFFYVLFTNSCNIGYVSLFCVEKKPLLLLLLLLVVNFLYYISG